VANDSYYRKGVVGLEIKRDMDFVRCVVNFGLDGLVKLFMIAIELTMRCVVVFG